MVEISIILSIGSITASIAVAIFTCFNKVKYCQSLCCIVRMKSSESDNLPSGIGNLMRSISESNDERMEAILESIEAPLSSKSVNTISMSPKKEEKSNRSI